MSQATYNLTAQDGGNKITIAMTVISTNDVSPTYEGQLMQDLKDFVGNVQGPWGSFSILKHVDAVTDVTPA